MSPSLSFRCLSSIVHCLPSIGLRPVPVVRGTEPRERRLELRENIIPALKGRTGHARDAALCEIGAFMAY